MKGMKIQSLALVFVLLAAAPGLTAPKKKEKPAKQTIWQRILRLKEQEPPRTVRGDICVVSPRQNGVIWHDRPIFVWQGKATQVNLYREDAPLKPIWSSAVKKDQTSVSYDGSPLRPGIYIWKVGGKGTPAPSYFEVMGGADRDTMNGKLQPIQQKSLSAQAKVLARLDLWMQNELLSDAVMELYATSGIMPELETLRKEFVQLDCKTSQP
ncbi:MAG: hypothetical protein VKJ24_12355 [Synechococcales bacterium]|nr:hypothetical protein [Synechococcales bacterium]